MSHLSYDKTMFGSTLHNIMEKRRKKQSVLNKDDNNIGSWDLITTLHHSLFQ